MTPADWRELLTLLSRHNCALVVGRDRAELVRVRRALPYRPAER